MAPKKLTEADKKSILKLYREPEETTSTLADRFGVSNSTISRLLKASLPAKDYSRLIQQKRSTADKPTTSKSKPATATSKSNATPAASEELPTKPDKPAPVLKKRDKVEEPAVAEPAPAANQADGDSDKSTPTKRTRRRSSQSTPSVEEPAQLSLPDPEKTPEPTEPPTKAPPKLKLDRATAEVDEDEDEVTDTIPTDWDDVANLDDDYDEDDEDDEDDFEDDGEAWDGDAADAAPHLERLEITPLTDASLPRLCYVVVERSSSELVALPLRTFAHLGEIPETEGESRTLPVFDNHRVARRFSRRNQRVVKLPDGALLQTTSPYLMAKGITRLLIDGQVFALEEDDEDYETVDEADLE